jgi:hypothetical protein
LKYIDYTYMYIIQDLIESLTCMMLWSQFKDKLVYHVGQEIILK